MLRYVSDNLCLFLRSGSCGFLSDCPRSEQRSTKRAQGILLLCSGRYCSDLCCHYHNIAIIIVIYIATNNTSYVCKLRQYLAQQMFKLACRHLTIELSSVPEFNFMCR